MLRTGAALGVQPEAFWRLSLAEWRMLTEAAPGTTPMGRGELERLMAVWQDGDGT
ncbi:phage tail assembly chaperone [Brevundimonas sp.]|uniref:phage tail assembly chaperone n=1 Tax=Brevundimonas sp. TaxID=1871086 RepID=UPI00286A0734|nr:phage tail assembly chaperone [Brevundimonas sp.]